MFRTLIRMILSATNFVLLLGYSSLSLISVTLHGFCYVECRNRWELTRTILKQIKRKDKRVLLFLASTSSGS